MKRLAQNNQKWNLIINIGLRKPSANGTLVPRRPRSLVTAPGRGGIVDCYPFDREDRPINADKLRKIILALKEPDGSARANAMRFSIKLLGWLTYVIGRLGVLIQIGGRRILTGRAGGPVRLLSGGAGKRCATCVLPSICRALLRGQRKDRRSYLE
jgi:hypothetical protein